MNLICNGQLTIKCNTCNNVIGINGKDLSFEVVESHEREQGAEKCHSSDYQINCSKCNTQISIKYDVWEYSEGVVNIVDCDVKEGSVLQDCDFNFSD